ncbi:MAG: ABC transporter ATP-binding protein [Deltaproteobacteria bacterium]|nr:ABC transporter ATP-binding protein [Deltaproteobacteria bacterium]
MIQVEGLEKRFAQTVALGGISFKVPRGAIVGLLGPNGAGKTTCMRILSGALTPSAGHVRVGGMDVVEESLEVRRRVGYLPEGAPLYDELRVSEQLDFVARLRGIPRRRRRAAIDREVARCGVGDVRRRIVGQLSKGYRQRVGLACALVGEPEILILDEPTAVLTPQEGEALFRTMRILAEEGRSLIFISHKLHEVKQVSY